MRPSFAFAILALLVSCVAASDEFATLPLNGGDLMGPGAVDLAELAALRGDNAGLAEEEDVQTSAPADAEDEDQDEDEEDDTTPAAADEEEEEDIDEECASNPTRCPTPKARRISCVRKPHPRCPKPAPVRHHHHHHHPEERVFRAYVREHRRHRHHNHSVRAYIRERHHHHHHHHHRIQKKIARVHRFRIHYARLLKVLMRKMKHQIRFQTQLVRMANRLTARKLMPQVKRVRRKLRHCKTVLHRLEDHSNRVRALLKWAKEHASELERLKKMKLPDISTDTIKKEAWRPWMARRLDQDYHLGSEEDAPKGTEPKGFSWRTWAHDDKVRRNAARARREANKDASQSRRLFAKNAAKRLWHHTLAHQKHKLHGSETKLERIARRLARKKDALRAKEDARLQKVEREAKKDAGVIGQPGKAAAPKENAAGDDKEGIEVPHPASVAIQGVDVVHAFSQNPHGSNRDAVSKKWSDLADVKRMVDGSVRTLWRYRTGASQSFVVDFKLPGMYDVTGVDLFVPKDQAFSTGYAGVKIFTKTGDTEWKKAVKACGMFGKFDRSATDVCGNKNPAVSPSFRFNHWNKNAFTKVRSGVTEVRLVFGTADQMADSCVSLSEIRIMGFPTEGAKAKQIVEDNKTAPCPLGDKCNPAESCLEIKKKRAHATSAPYFITYLSKLYNVYCDMETQGGGWTAVINPSFMASPGLPIKATADKLAGTINSCGMNFYRDKLFGFHRLKAYACGNYRVQWNVEFRNTFDAHNVMIAGAIQGHTQRGVWVNGKAVDFKGVTGADGNYCAFVNGWQKSTTPQVNNCYNLDYSTSAPQVVEVGDIGPLLNVKIVSGDGCQPTCNYGTGFNLQQLYLR